MILFILIAVFIVRSSSELKNNANYNETSQAFNYQKGAKILKDGSLISFANYLNENKNFFLKWKGEENNYVDFFDLLKPWMLSDFQYKLNSTTKPVYDLNCIDRKYISVLKGTVLKVPRRIVDFVPFGYDVDKLLIRLYETFDYVDIFVIYESTRTQSGMPKPLYFNLLKNDSRFRQFQHKIIHLISDDTDLSHITQRTKHHLAKLRKGERVVNKDLWALEYSMRTEMIRKFTKLASSNSNLQNLLSNNISNALGIQNDADEIISGKVLYHLKYCEIRTDVKGIFTPAFLFKRNVHWLEHTSDLGCLEQDFAVNIEPLLKSYLWRPGPYVWPLQMMLDARNTLRDDFSNNFQCKYHMGIGAAVHLSSITDPVESWLKRCGVIEQDCSTALTTDFLKAGRDGTITPTQIFVTSTKVACKNIHHDNAYVPNLIPSARVIVEQSVPWIIRQNPNSFPFIIPEKTSNDNIGGIIKKFSKLDWNEICEQ